MDCIELKPRDFRWPSMVYRGAKRVMTVKAGDHVWVGDRLAEVLEPLGASARVRLYERAAREWSPTAEVSTYPIEEMRPAGVAHVGGVVVVLGA